MNKIELTKVLSEHKRWIMGEGGCYASLSNADLSYASLRGASLSNADLSNADLSNADLSNADLSYASLRDTILNNINWLAYIGIVPNKSGVAFAYKITTGDGEGIYQGGINYIKARRFEVDEVDANVNIQCSYGINLATFGWCLNQFTSKSRRLFMFEFNVKDAVCPVGSHGKFRVKKCTKVGECDWTGNLKGV